MVKEAIDVYIQGELWPKAKRCAAEMAPKYVTILILNLFYLFSWRRVGLMAHRVLVCGSSSLGSSPGQGDCVVFSSRHFTLTVPASIYVLVDSGKFNAGR